MFSKLYNLVARIMVEIHSGISPIFGEKSFASWALAIVFLVMGVRLLLVPAFVKSIKSQRQMALMQPKVAELRKKYKDDKQTLNQELMKLQQEHGNPLLGCLPLLIQIPLFLSLFRVMNSFRPIELKSADAASKAAVNVAAKTSTWICPNGTNLHDFCYKPAHGLKADVVQNIANAKAFGVSISAAFTSPHKLLSFLHANGTAVKIATVLLIVLMTASTYVTQLQTMRRNPAPTEPSQAQIQKLLLYLGPGFLFLFGFNFPVGVLLYWLTTNVWSLVQQHVVMSRMPAILPAGPAVPTGPPPKANQATTTPAADTVKPEKRNKRKGSTAQPTPAPQAQPVYRQRTTQKKRKKR